MVVAVVAKLGRREKGACVETCEPVAEPQLICRTTAPHSSKWSPDNVSGALVARRSGETEAWRELPVPADGGRRRVPPTSRGSPGGGVLLQPSSGDLEDWREELVTDGGKLERQSLWNISGEDVQPSSGDLELEDWRELPADP